MTILESIELEGFLSYVQPTHFQLNRNGVWFIKGENGAGKTAIFAALTWCIYQIDIRNRSEVDVPTKINARTDAWRGTRVQLHLTKHGKQYLIARHIQYTTHTQGYIGGDALIVFEKTTNGFKRLKAQGKKDAQKLVEDLIGLDSTTFLNTFLFAQNAIRFTDLKGAAQKMFFNELFKIDFCDKAAEKVKVAISTLDTVLRDTQNQSTLKEQQYTNLLESFAFKKAQISDFESRKAARIQTLNSDLNALIAKKEAMEAQMWEHSKQLPIAKKKHEHAATLIGYLQNELSTSRETLNKTIAQFVRHETNLQHLKAQTFHPIETECNICGAMLNPQKVNELIQTQFEAKRLHTQQVNASQVQLNELIESKNNQHAVVAQIEKQYSELEKQLNDAVQQTKNHNRALCSLGDELQDLETSIKNAQNRIVNETLDTMPFIDLNALQSDLDALRKEIQGLQNEMSEQLRKKTILTYWKKAFAPNGIKSFVFDAALNQINTLLERYAAPLQLSVRIGIDTLAHDKAIMITCYKNGNANELYSYYQLSGGQQRRVDMAILLALHDYMSIQNGGLSLLALDEVDSGLSESGVAILLDLLRYKDSKGLTVFIISHNPFAYSDNGKMIHVKMENKATVLC